MAPKLTLVLAVPVRYCIGLVPATVAVPDVTCIDRVVAMESGQVTETERWLYHESIPMTVTGNKSVGSLHTLAEVIEAVGATVVAAG